VGFATGAGAIGGEDPSWFNGKNLMTRRPEAINTLAATSHPPREVTRGIDFWRDMGRMTASWATAAKTRARRVDLSACSFNRLSAWL